MTGCRAFHPAVRAIVNEEHGKHKKIVVLPFEKPFGFDRKKVGGPEKKRQPSIR